MIIEWKDTISELESPKVALDRAALFGDGFFTTGIIQRGQLQFREYHLERIKQSAERLMFYSLSIKTIAELIEQACVKQANSVLRINISRQQNQRGYAIDANAEIKVQIILSHLPTQQIDDCKLIDSNVAISINPNLAGIKHLNRLDSVLASSQLPDPHAEALMYAENRLICGSKSNLFVYLDGLWQTPKLDLAGVAGIMRQTVLDRMDKIGEAYKIAEIDRSQLAKISSAFITNCVIGVLPASHINEAEICTISVRKLKQRLSL